VLAALEFKALATTSSAFAFTLGRRDGEVTLDEVVAHTRALVEATPLPVSVDLENGYGPAPEDAARAVSAAAEAGAAGGSIEDYDPRDDAIYPLEHAVERVRAAVDAAAGRFVLTARAENLIHGVDDLDGTIARLQAFEQAGADVLYAPGLRDAGQIRAVRDAVSRPLNVLVNRGLTAREAFDAGAQRVSVGGALAWAAVERLVEVATSIRDAGDTSGLRGSDVVPYQRGV
jgi:2-methylisocitrate lyase-like PEP mutase family enzyme